MRPLAWLVILVAYAGCGRVPFFAVEVLDRPALPGECIEVSAQDSAAAPLKVARLLRDGGTRYTLGFADSKGRGSLWFQAQVLSRCGEASAVVRGESERKLGEPVDGGAGVVSLAIRAVDQDGDGVRAADAGGTDCNDDDPQVSPLAAEQCQSLGDFNCDSRRGCDDPQCGSAAVCAKRLHFTEPGAQVAAGACALVEVARGTADGGLVFDGTDAVRFAAADLQGPADVLFGSAACDAKLDGGVSIAAGTAVARAWLRSKEVGPLTLSAEWAYGPATRATRIVAGPAAGAVLSVPDAAVAGDCVPGALAVVDRFGNPSSVDGGSVPATFFGMRGALYGDGGCVTPLSTVQLFDGTRQLPVYFASAFVGQATVGATFAGTDAGVRQVQVTPARPEELAFGRWDSFVTRFACRPFSLRALDRFGNRVSAPVQAVLAADAGTLGAEFFTDLGCTQPLTGSLTLLDGGAEASVRFAGSGTGAIDATSAGLRGASAGVILSGGVEIEPSVIPLELEAGACVPLTLTRRVVDGGAHSLGPLTASASVMVGTRVAISSIPSCITYTTDLQVQFPNGAATQTVYVRGLSSPTPSPVTVTLREAGGPVRTLTVQPLPLVRRGDCTLAGVAARRCLVSPPIPGDDVSRTFLVMQSTSDGVEPQTMASECHLEADGGVFVVCSRVAATGTARVQWQTVSYGRPASAGGVSVQHRWGIAPDASVTVVPGQVTGRSFALLSYSQAGGLAEDHDHYAVVLDGGGFTVTAVAPNDTATNLASVQVVELGDPGAVDHVDQWLSANAVAWNTPLPGPAASPSTSSVLTSVQANVPSNHVCGRSFTATASMTDVQVSRGLSDVTCLNATTLRRVSVQRIRWPWAAQVVGTTAQVALGPGAGLATVVAARTVALDRSLTWLGTQGMGGQSWGQVSYFTPDGGEEDAIGAATGVVTPGLAPGLSFTLERGSVRGTAVFSPTFVEFTP